MQRLLIAFLASIALAGAAYAQIPRPITPQGASSNGRFQIFFSPHARADTYMIDTQTGRLWRPMVFSYLQGEPEVFVPMERFDSGAELTAWAATMKEKNKH